MCNRSRASYIRLRTRNKSIQTITLYNSDTIIPCIKCYDKKKPDLILLVVFLPPLNLRYISDLLESLSILFDKYSFTLAIFLLLDVDKNRHFCQHNKILMQLYAMIKEHT